MSTLFILEDKAFGIVVDQEICEEIAEHEPTINGCEFKTSYGYTRYMPLTGNYPINYGKCDFYQEVLLWLNPNYDGFLPDNAYEYVSEAEIKRYINEHRLYWQVIPDVVEERK